MIDSAFDEVSRLRLSAGEMAAAKPSRALAAELALVTFERNAFRDRCHALERMVAFLTGRAPEPAALDREVNAIAQRDAVLAILKEAALPAAAVS